MLKQYPLYDSEAETIVGVGEQANDAQIQT
jgi:hypothetical protein